MLSFTKTIVFLKINLITYKEKSKANKIKLNVNTCKNKFDFLWKKYLTKYDQLNKRYITYGCLSWKKKSAKKVRVTKN